MKIGLNVLQVEDENALLMHIGKAKYPAALFYGDRAPVAYACKRKYPHMTVIVRQWPDENLRSRFPSPAEYLKFSQPISDNGCVIHGHNEAGLSQDVIDWEYELARLAIAQKKTVIVLNPSTGTYDHPDFDRAAKLILLASEFPANVIIGLHAYAGGVITSGIYGGFPDDAGADPSKPEQKGTGKNLIPVTAWPSKTVTERETCFHIGRHRFLYRWCDDRKIKRPRVIITETSWDWTGDIGTWLGKLQHEGGSVNGFKTLAPQWAEWYKGISRDTIATEQMIWADQNQFHDVEAAIWFGHGNNPDWDKYNIADTDIPRLLEEYAEHGTTPPPPVEPPKPEPPPAVYTYRHTVTVTGSAQGDVKAAITYLQLMAQALQETLVPSLEGVTEIKITGE